jgi:acetoacetate decarboxylase
MTIRYGARSPEQIENREVKATSVGAWSTSFTAIYETDPDVIAAVLPPPLQSSDEPLVRVSIATVDIGAGRPPFGAGTFAVQARHEGTIGNYPLVMPMTTEQSVIGGRETFGEPKKLARIALDRVGARLHGTVTRLGITFLELTGEVTAQLEPPADRERVDFYFKFLPAPDGKGFDTEPALVYCRRQESARKVERVDGEVLLHESRFDPVVDLPVRRIVEMSMSERRSIQTGEIVERVPSEWLVPYAHQRYDDLSPIGGDAR